MIDQLLITGRDQGAARPRWPLLLLRPLLLGKHQTIT